MDNRQTQGQHVRNDKKHCIEEQPTNRDSEDDRWKNEMRQRHAAQMMPGET